MLENLNLTKLSRLARKTEGVSMAIRIQEHTDVWCSTMLFRFIYFLSEQDKSISLNMGTMPAEDLQGKRHQQIIRARDANLR